ncbi:MAG TPA: hypothetical protein VGH90_11195 [Chthoniobacteraceae bacterium]|jgi:cytochrome c556
MNRKRHTLSVLALTVALSAYALDPKYQPIADAMKFAHKAPKGEKRVSDRIIEGTASDEETKKTLALYKAMADTEPPKGDPAVFKQKVAKLITATEDVVAKKDGAAAAYKEAVNCKSCHSDFRPE